jgi:YD repeat-containing protein
MWQRRDRGASTIEYVALLMIVALVVAAATLVIPNPVGDSAKVALCKLFSAISGGNGNCERKPFEYKPSPAACVTGQDSNTIGGSVTIFSVKVGENFQLVTIKTADGKTKVMVVPIDFKIGATGELGGKLTIGGKSLGAQAGANVEGTVGLKYGDTWIFPNDQAASDFVNKMKWDWGRHEAEKVSPGLWLFDKVTGWHPKTPPPDIQQTDISVDGLASLGINVGNPTTKNGKKSVTDIGTGLKVDGTIGDSVQLAKQNTNPSDPNDPSYPRTTVTFTVHGSVSGGGKVFGYGPSGSGDYSGQTKVTRDKNGRLVSITWITTHEESDSNGYQNPGGKRVQGKGSDKKVTTTSTTVNFDDSNRAIGEQWIHDNAFLMPLQTVRNAWDPSGAYKTQQPPADASEMDKLIYNQGIVSKNTYAGDVNQLGLGVEGGDAVKFGIDLSYQHDRQYLVDSQYLAPPQNGSRSFVEWPECKNGAH